MTDQHPPPAKPAGTGYRRAEGTLRPLLDLAATWEETLTGAGLDVVAVNASLAYQSTIQLRITGGDTELRAALALIEIPIEHRPSTHQHEDLTTVSATFLDVPGVEYVIVAAEHPKQGEGR